jgi:hypothetical protein
VLLCPYRDSSGLDLVRPGRSNSSIIEDVVFPENVDTLLLFHQFLIDLCHVKLGIELLLVFFEILDEMLEALALVLDVHETYLNLLGRVKCVQLLIVIDLLLEVVQEACGVLFL